MATYADLEREAQRYLDAPDDFIDPLDALIAEGTDQDLETWLFQAHEWDSYNFMTACNTETEELIIARIAHEHEQRTK